MPINRLGLAAKRIIAAFRVHDRHLTTELVNTDALAPRMSIVHNTFVVHLFYSGRSFMMLFSHLRYLYAYSHLINCTGHYKKHCSI